MFAIVDIEASGSKYPQGRIIDLAILLHDGHEIVREYQTLVNPGHPITDFYQKLTGITNQMLERAPSFQDIAEEVFDLLKDAHFVAHNVSFDYEFMRRELAAAGFTLDSRRLCSFKLAQKYLPGHQKYGLSSLAADLGIPMDRVHRAYDDAKATARVLEIILEKYQIAAG